ncbi:MAG: hypothetical protein GY792_28880 [Gammaproteobacteria bacterium]|nr:hypothetical protein [Gammaproteobacteria bacterium]MCP4336050.1 hypothetical protein [Gammaproteobacteria bacterium]
MRNIRTIAVTGLLSVFVGLTSVQPVRATGIPVIDVANLSQTIIQVTNDITKISHQASQIANQVNQINNQVQMLRNIGPSQFSQLASVLGMQSTELGTILSSASEVQYSLSNIQSQIDNTFPQGGDWSSFDMNTISARLQQWDNAVTAANSVAMRAQSSLNRVQSRNTQLQSLINQSRTENGQVRQLQLNAQINGQIAQALNDNAAVTATVARAQMLEQQRLVAERELGREQHNRAMNNFTDRGTPVSVLSGLPAVAPHP